jgi:hypothetical protein
VGTLVGTTKCKKVENIKRSYRTELQDTDGVNLAQDTNKWQALMETVLNLQVLKNVGEFLD